MKTVYTNSLYSVEITRTKMESIINRCKHNGIIDRVKLNGELRQEVLQDGNPDMMDREFNSETEAKNTSNYTGSVEYYSWSVPFFKVSARVIEKWVYDSDDEVCDEYSATDVSDFTDDDIEKIIDQYPLFS